MELRLYAAIYEPVRRSGSFELFYNESLPLLFQKFRSFSILLSKIAYRKIYFLFPIHNVPEGVAIALPVYGATGRKDYALVASMVSGLAEPLGAALDYFILAPYMSHTIYGMVFGIIGGVMVYLALDELLPTAKRFSKGHETVYGLVSGMAALATSLVIFKFVQ